MTALSHLRRLRTLTVDVDPAVPNFKFNVLPTPQPPPLRNFTVSARASRDLWVSCPALAPGAVVHFSTVNGQVGLAEAPGHLAGCRLELSAASVMIAYEGQMDNPLPHVGLPDLMEHLFRWIKTAGAKCAVLQPHCDLDDEELAEIAQESDGDDEPFHGGWPGRVFHLEVDSGGERQYKLLADPDGTSELQRELRLRSARHGFRFEQSDHRFCLTRLA